VEIAWGVWVYLYGELSHIELKPYFSVTFRTYAGRRALHGLLFDSVFFSHFFYFPACVITFGAGGV
jgi:hypothetical protein